MPKKERQRREANKKACNRWRMLHPDRVAAYDETNGTDRKYKFVDDHPERVKASKSNYLENHPERDAASKSKYVENRPDRVAASKSNYSKDHPERVKSSKSNYVDNRPKRVKSSKSKYSNDHPERVTASKKKYDSSHPELVADRKRKANNSERVKQSKRDWSTANRELDRRSKRNYDQRNKEQRRVFKRAYELRNRGRVRRWRMSNSLKNARLHASSRRKKSSRNAPTNNAGHRYYHGQTGAIKRLNRLKRLNDRRVEESRLRRQRYEWDLVIDKNYRRNIAIMKAGVNSRKTFFVNRIARLLRRKNKKLSIGPSEFDAKVIVEKLMNVRVKCVMRLKKSLSGAHKFGDNFITAAEMGGDDGVAMEDVCGAASHSESREPYFYDAAYDLYSEKDVPVPLKDKPCDVKEPSWDCKSNCVYPANAIERLLGICSRLKNPHGFRRFIANIDHCTNGRHVHKSSTEGPGEVAAKYPDENPKLESQTVESDEKAKVEKKAASQTVESDEKAKVEESPLGEYKVEVLDKLGHQIGCFPENCTSDLLFLRRLSVHFPAVRPFMIAVYDVMMFDKQLHAVDTALSKGDLGTIEGVLSSSLAKRVAAVANDDRITCTESEEKVLEMRISGAKYAKSFLQDLANIPIHPCISCREFNLRKQVRQIRFESDVPTPTVSPECSISGSSESLISRGSSSESLETLSSGEESSSSSSDANFDSGGQSSGESNASSDCIASINGELEGMKVYTGASLKRKNAGKACNELWREIYGALKVDELEGKEVDWSKLFICHRCFTATTGAVARKRAKDGSLQHESISIFNKNEIRKTPKEIEELNSTELGVMKPVKCFQSIIRLGTIGSKLPGKFRVKAHKGQVVHYPLPMSETLKQLPKRGEMPAGDENLFIILYGVPTKNKTVWKAFVDVEKIRKAVAVLKKINPLYADVPDDWDALMAIGVTEEEPCDPDVLKECADMANRNKPTLRRMAEGEEENLYTEYTVRDLFSKRPTDKSDVELFQAERVEAQRLDPRADTVEPGCFPHLFPDGRNHEAEKRDIPMSKHDYVKSRLFNENPKFRHDQEYLFFLLHKYFMKSVANSISHSLRMSFGVDTMTAGDFVQKVKEGDQELNANLSTAFSSIRGSAEYWARQRLDLRTMVRRLGAPTWFLTLSAAEYEWKDMQDLLIAVNKHIKGIEEMGSGERCAMDPVMTSGHMHRRFVSFLNKVILNKNGPLGEVVDFFWRCEYQARGTAHFHMVLWVKDAPKIGVSEDQEVIDFIQKYATCSLPNKDKEPLLHRLVTTFQKHDCNDYCKRKWRWNCRFQFPRPECPATILNSDPVTNVANRFRGKAERLYSLRRTKEETRINDYNAEMLLLWQANMDIAFCGENSNAIVDYIVNYITKKEKAALNDLWNEMRSDKSAWCKLFNIGCRAVSMRECGAYEAADLLLGRNLFGKSRQVKYIAARQEEKRLRLMKTYTKIKELDPGSTDVYENNWISTYYPARPDAMEEMCLYDFISKHERRAKMKDEQDDSDMDFKIPAYGKLKVRKKEYLISHPNPDRDTQKEEFCYMLLLLFKPFRNEAAELIDPVTGSCIEVYEEERKTNEQLREYEQDLIARAEHEREVKEAIEKAKNAPLSQTECDDDCEPDMHGDPIEAEVAMEEFEHLMGLIRSQETFKGNYDQMNEDQRRVFDGIIEDLQKKDAQLLRFISGAGGVGKSFIIETLKLWAQEFYKTPGNHIAVAAPTGLAAFNVSGLTLHRMLQLPITHNLKTPYAKLHERVCKELRKHLEGVKVIVVDEVSMVSNKTLQHIHLRLNEIFPTGGEPRPFAGLNVIVMGDLCQLPPVGDGPVFREMRSEHVSKSIGGFAQADLWSLFTYDELTQNMRQSGDREFASILGRLRFGQLDDNDIKRLNTRLIDKPDGMTYFDAFCEKYKSLRAAYPNLLSLMPLQKMVQRFNNAMLNMESAEIVEVPAIDNFRFEFRMARPHEIEKAKQDLKKKSEKSDNETAGIEDKIRLAVGARVMLVRNGDVKRGLVNGATGLVTRLVADPKTKAIDHVYVKFDNIDKEQLIQRSNVEFQLNNNMYVHRRQFPLTLAYAITIHKSQGMSVDQILVDAGNCVFSGGMTYVALSRCRTLEGLHLMNFDPKRAYVNVDCIKEINRLRDQYRADLDQIPVKRPTRTGVPDRPWFTESFVALGPTEELAPTTVGKKKTRAAPKKKTAAKKAPAKPKGKAMANPKEPVKKRGRKQPTIIVPPEMPPPVVETSSPPPIPMGTLDESIDRKCDPVPKKRQRKRQRPDSNDAKPIPTKRPKRAAKTAEPIEVVRPQSTNDLPSMSEQKPIRIKRTKRVRMDRDRVQVRAPESSIDLSISYEDASVSAAMANKSKQNSFEIPALHHASNSKPPGFENPLVQVKRDPPGKGRRSVACYANATMHALMSLDYFRTRCSDFSHIPDRIHQELFAFKNRYEACEGMQAHRQLLSTRNLRHALSDVREGNLYKDSDGENDSIFLFQDLLEAAGLIDEFVLEYREIGRCTHEKCNDKSEKLIAPHKLPWLNLIPTRRKSANPKFPGDPKSLSELLSEFVLTRKKCANRKCEMERKIHFERCPNQFAIRLQRHEPRNTTPLRNFTPNIEINGDQYRVMAAIERFGETTRWGHYVAYVRRGCAWWQCNDGIVTEVGQIPRQLADIVYLFVQKENTPIIAPQQSVFETSVPPKHSDRERIVSQKCAKPTERHSLSGLIPPGLPNPMFACYSNVAMQALMSLASFREKCATSLDTTKPVQKALYEFYHQYEQRERGAKPSKKDAKRETNNTTALRKALAEVCEDYKDFDRPMELDALDFMQAVIDTCGMEDGFQLVVQDKYLCFGCNQYSLGTVEQMPFLNVMGEGLKSLETLMSEARYLREKKCDKCDKTGRVNSFFEFIHLPDQFIVRFPMYDEVEDADPLPSVMPNLQINNTPYRVVAVIKHIGRDRNRGHYIARVRRGDTWWLCDDYQVRKGDVNEPEKRQLLYEENIQLLILEKDQLALAKTRREAELGRAQSMGQEADSSQSQEF